LAYAYQDIDDFMSGQTQGQQNQNVFNTQDSQGAGAPQGQIDPNAVKTNTEGDINSGGGGNASQPKKVDTVSSDQTNRNAAATAFKANAGKTQTPAAVAGVQESIKQQNSGLAQRAADYSQAQKGKQNYGLDTSILDQAIGGESGARAKTSELLGRASANQADQFDPGNVKVKDADLLNSDAGLKELAARGQGPQYTPGMAAFDSMLLRRDPGFQNQVQDLQRQSNELSAKAGTEKDRLEKEANTYGASQLKLAQDNAKGYLGSQSKAILDENANQALTANQGLKNLDLGKIKGDAEAQARAKAKADLDRQFGAGRADQILASIGANPGDYLKVANGYDANQFYSDQDAQRYNMINSLLGLGGQSVQASAPVADPYSLDSTGLYNNLFNQASQARMGQDTSDQNEIQNILAAAQGRAQSQNDSRSKLASQYGQALDLAGQTILGNDEFNNVRKFATPDNLKTFNQQYQTSTPLDSSFSRQLQGSDVLGQDEADRLNALSRDLGASNQYGQGADYNSAPGSLLNGDSYKKALMDYLQGLHDQPSPLTSTIPNKPTNISPTITQSGDVRVQNQDSPLYKIERGFQNLGDQFKRWF
jgi:hypothetical protein